MKLVLRRLQRVVVPQPVFSRGDKARSPQIGEMPRGRWLRHLQNPYKIPYAEFTIKQQMQDSQARRIGKRAKH